MTGWGDSEWGLSPWGSPAGPPSYIIHPGPVIVEKYPYHQQIGVPEDVTILVRIFDPTYNLDTSTILLYINNVQVYSGVTGFTTGYIGRVTILAGVVTLQVAKVGGYSFEEIVTARIYAEDDTAYVVDDTWYFTIRENPICYGGITPLPIELSIQTPFTTYLSLEFFRKLLLNNSLRAQGRAINNRGNKEARVVYQTAFATELSTLQNPFLLRDEEALAVTVCERQRTIYIDTQLQKYLNKLNEAVNELRVQRILPEEYLRTFADYADSSLYVYRVSLVANMLLFAKSKELEL